MAKGEGGGKTREMKIFSIDLLVGEFRAKGEEAFRRRYNFPVLLASKEPPVDSGWLDLKTEESLVSRKPRGETSRKRTAIAVVKSDRNAYKAKITIGRAKNNDIVLRAAKVSKVHAALIPDEDGNFTLQDMGSSNGTKLNDERLKVNEPAPIRTGDVIKLWRFEFEYHEPDSFARMIKILA